MKKLLVTVIGAAAAIGASAFETAKRFEGMTQGETTVAALNTEAAGTFWSEGANASNTYAIVAMDAQAGLQHPAAEAFVGSPNNALSVKTPFGSPLTFNAIDGGATGQSFANGLYFDSLVKFTVCEDDPAQEYTGAKIVMWLQEEYGAGDVVVGTNLYVKAGYLAAGGVSNAIYKCDNTIEGDFADKWHRVTIKAIADITEGGDIVPAFAIFIDGGAEGQKNVASDAAKWDGTLALTEDAANRTYTKLFPSMNQTQASGELQTLTSASFDGTGSLNELVFTDAVPEFAKDYVAPKATVTIGSGEPVEYGTLAEAVAAVNALSNPDQPPETPVVATFALAKGMTIPDTLAFAPSNGVNVVFDFAGITITNASSSAAAITVSGAGTLTVTNSTEEIGGVYCADDGAALEFTTGGLEIYAGIFNGAVTLDVGAEVTGGSFKDDVGVADYLAEGKRLVLNSTTGLYDVDDIPAVHTITFDAGANATVAPATTNYTIESGVITLPTPVAAVLGVTFGGWTNETITTAITSYTPAAGDGSFTLYAKWDAVAPSTLTLVSGDNSTVDPSSYNFFAGGAAIALPTPTLNPGVVGVTFGGWTNAAITEATMTFTPPAENAENVTLYAKWDAVAPSVITFEPGRADAVVSPATTNFWAGGAAITLPTPAITSGVVGVTFVGWTNATITTAIKTFTPPAENAESFTLYAEWDVVAPTYPSYIDTSDATVKGQYDTWKTTYSVADGQNDLEKAFLLNINPQLGLAQLTSTDVAISGTTVTINLNYGNLNGYPYVKKAATLAGLATAVATPVTVVPADNIENGGSVTLTGESGATMFYQIGVQSAPVVVPNN